MLSSKANGPKCTQDFDIEKVVLFSAISEITIIKHTKCYLWWTSMDFILDFCFLNIVLKLNLLFQ